MVNVDKYNKDTKSLNRGCPEVSEDKAVEVKVIQMKIASAIGKDKRGDKGYCSGCKDWACGVSLDMSDGQIREKRLTECKKPVSYVREHIRDMSEIDGDIEFLMEEYDVPKDLDASVHPNAWHPMIAAAIKDFDLRHGYIQAGAVRGPKSPAEWAKAYKIVCEQMATKAKHDNPDLNRDDPALKLHRLYESMESGGKIRAHEFCQCPGFVCRFRPDSSDAEIDAMRCDECPKDLGYVKKTLKSESFVKPTIEALEEAYPEIRKMAETTDVSAEEMPRDPMEMLLRMMMSRGGGSPFGGSDPEDNE